MLEKECLFQDVFKYFYRWRNLQFLILIIKLHSVWVILFIRTPQYKNFREATKWIILNFT